MDEENNKYVRADAHCARAVRGIEHKMKVESRDIIERKTFTLPSFSSGKHDIIDTS